MGWTIYYDDESIFSDADGTWYDAPTYGVLFVQEDRTWDARNPVTSEYYKLIHMGSDYYLLRDNTIMAFREKELYQHLELGIDPHSLKYGRWTDNTTWKRVHDRVFPLNKN